MCQLDLSKSAPNAVSARRRSRNTMLRIGDNFISYRGKCLVALEKYAGKALKSDGPADGDEGRRRSEADSAGYGFLVPAVCVVPVVLDFRLVIRSLRGTGKLQFVADIARLGVVLARSEEHTSARDDWRDGCSHQGEAQETFSACLEQRLLRIDGLRVGERAQIDRKSTRLNSSHQ